MELWVDLELPYAHRGHTPLCFMRQHFMVLHAAPRLLVVQVHAPAFSAVIFVAHAPQSKHGPQAKAEFWDLMDSLATKWKPDITLLDANGPSSLRNDSIVSDIAIKLLMFDSGSFFSSDDDCKKFPSLVFTCF